MSHLNYKTSLLIYGQLVHIHTDNERVNKLLEKDFYYFNLSNNETSPVLNISINSTSKIPWDELNGLVSTRQTSNAIGYEDLRFNYFDYYSKALVKIDKSSKKVTLHSKNNDLIHEIAYLLILSVTGKKLDLAGSHKVHALGVSYNDTALILMMPSKGGKTTHFLKLIEDKEVNILSDDTPLILSSGIVCPFPLRVGLENGVPLPKGNKPDLIYSINRSQHGKKILIPINYFENKISNPCKKVILINGIRAHGETSQLISKSKLSMLKPLVGHMGIGIGLPMVLEYFLEMKFRDLFKLSWIFTRRLFAIFNLLLRSQCYTAHLGNNIDKNIEMLNLKFKS